MKLIIPAIILTLSAGGVRAAETARIEAVVGGEAITSRSLDERAKLSKALIEAAGAKMTDREIRARALSEMIDDKVRLLEAAKYGISANEAEVIDMQNRMEAMAHLPGGYRAALEKAGVSEDVLKSQIKADATWMKFVSNVLRPYVKVLERDVDSAIAGEGDGAAEYTFAPFFPKDGAAAPDSEKCEEFSRMAKELGEPGSGEAIKIMGRDMQKDLAELVSVAPVPSLLPPVKINGREVLFFVCSREEKTPDISHEDRERIKLGLFQSKLEAYAAKYFMNAKEGAIIDIKGAEAP